jgi:nitrogen regulatory protein PII
MKFVVAIIKPARSGHGKIAVLDLRSAVRVRAGETDAAAILEPAPSPL